MIKIKIVDAIMGSGKTEAAITYMNEHRNERFIYVTPYLDEVSRIRRGCPDIEIYEPRRKAELGGSKVSDTFEMIKQNKNIATTHQAFTRYTKDMLQEITDRGYILIFDESLNVLSEIDKKTVDIQLMISDGYVEFKNGEYVLTDKEYKGDVMMDFYIALQNKSVIKSKDEGDDAKQQTFFYWKLPASFFTAFKEAFILTYLFEGQDLHHLFEMSDVSYKYIGIDFDGLTYRFSDHGNYVPRYVTDLKNKIHILDNKKMNAIGNDSHALSMNWYKRNPGNPMRVKNNIYNYFRHITNARSKKTMWGTYKSYFYEVRPRGYAKRYVVFNMRASNDYVDCDTLAYCVNLYLSVPQKRYYKQSGIEVSDDLYALSTMIQWIWRSAIRRGEDIQIYIPSRRMRDLLKGWLDRLSKGGY